MYMQLYYKDLEGKRYVVCEVDVYIVDYANLKGDKMWYIQIKPSFMIKNCLEFVMKNPSRDLVESLDSIQKLHQEYHDHKTGRFPEAISYVLNDPKMKEDKATIITEIRKQLREIAERHDLEYNED